ncbi:hypothetical protein BJ508DRAFT_316177 [Ascobolus immersus RN42]|uniref:Uncharacterized protein n=1 Tax=Ascobolus immersus RN42 TaxID=1160509 RepID=A0A3N4HCF3_ASCIM|nr:hypothetical protein BJ508DRAFT_316177 [Ascobolus immersus RN42]
MAISSVVGIPPKSPTMECIDGIADYQTTTMSIAQETHTLNVADQDASGTGSTTSSSTTSSSTTSSSTTNSEENTTLTTTTTSPLIPSSTSSLPSTTISTASLYPTTTNTPTSTENTTSRAGGALRITPGLFRREDAEIWRARMKKWKVDKSLFWIRHDTAVVGRDGMYPLKRRR